MPHSPSENNAVSCFYCGKPIGYSPEEIWAMDRNGLILAVRVRSRKTGKSLELYSHANCHSKRSDICRTLSVEALDALR